MDGLMRHQWPGNVRELMNAIERAVVMSTSDFIQTKDLPFLHSQTQPHEPRQTPTWMPASVPLEEVERTAILETLEQVGGNKSAAARKLGITRKTLHKKLQKYKTMS
jgi:two-component system, NtrC family, response regulator HydG